MADDRNEELPPKTAPPSPDTTPVEAEGVSSRSTPREPESAKKGGLTQDVIAQRVAALDSTEAEADRIAEQEEIKLAERRAQQKHTMGKKGALEASASAKLAKIGEKKMARSRSAGSSVAAADPLLESAENIARWFRTHAKVVAYVGVAAVILVTGLVGYSFQLSKKESEASTLLGKAIEMERGRIGALDNDREDDRPVDPGPVFKTEEERRAAALAKYREVESRYSGTGAAIWARLGEASLHLDQHDSDAAIAAYTEVIASPLARVDPEVKGRALEGIGLSHELKAMSLAGESAAQALDLSIKSFRELENTDVKGFKELGMYHQARCFEAKGEKEKAIELLKSARERTRASADTRLFPYLTEMIEQRLRSLDPSALASHAGPPPGGSGGANSLNAEQIKQLIERMKKQQPTAGGGGGSPSTPPSTSETPGSQ